MERSKMQDKIEVIPSLKKDKKGHGIKGLLLTGLIFILPLYITWILLKLVIGWLKGLLSDTFGLFFKLTIGNFIGAYYEKIEWVFLFVIGLPIIIVFLIVVGWAAQNLFGKKILVWAENSVKKIPFLGGIYSASRQLVDTVFLKGKENYKRVVMIEYPRKGTWMMAFVTGENSKINPFKDSQTDLQTLSVFVPTTPNPTSGFLVFVKKEEVVPVDISVEDGLKLIISGGILEPSASKSVSSNSQSHPDNKKDTEKSE